VTKGPSRGAIVRCIERCYPPPGCDGKCLSVLPGDPPSVWRARVWWVDRELDWVVPRIGRCIRIKAAPDHALLPLFE
jgi:hypothetical protein